MHNSLVNRLLYQFLSKAQKLQEFAIDIDEQSLILNFGAYLIHIPKHDSSGFSKSLITFNETLFFSHFLTFTLHQDI